ncbi:MAG: T9SS type A sorting domain-containing protein [Bacteroidales bacterium]
MKTNVYKLVLGVFITLLSFSVNAQNYQYIPIVKPGLQLWTWDYGLYEYNLYHFRRYALTDEDTIIENEIYKKLYQFTDIEFNPLTAEYYGGLRENAQKQVFYMKKNYNNTETLLYDFSLSVGDTFRMADPSNTATLEIASIYKINYNGFPRKKFTINLQQTYPIGDIIAGVWIEGIGNYEGILKFPSNYAADDWSITRCYIHNGDLLYSNYSHGGNDCITPLMGVESIIEDNSITIYPNPTSSEVNISSENIINSIEIFNSLGQRVYQSMVNSTEKVIDISSFVNGIYILGVNTGNGVIRKKIIKN